MIIEELLVKLKAETTEFQQGMEEVRKRLEDQGVKIRETFSEASNLALAAGSAITGAIGFMVKAAAEEESAQAKLNTILKATGQYSEEASESIMKLSEAIAEKTGIDETALEDGARMLLQFGATTDQAKQLLPVLANLSTAMGVDIENAAARMGQVFEGNYNALRRYGIDLREFQKQIDSLQQKMNDTQKELDVVRQRYENGKISASEYKKETEALTAKYKELQKQLEDLQSPAAIANAIIQHSASINGLAEEQAKTLSGQLAVLREEFEHLAKEMGATLIPILKDLLENGVKPFLDNLSKMNPVVLENIMKITALVGVFLVTSGTLVKVVSGVVSMIETFQKLVTVIKAISELPALGMLFSPTGLVLLGIGALITGILLIIRYWDQIKAGMTKFYEKFIEPWLDPLISGLKVVIGLFEKVEDWFKRLGDKIKGSLANTSENLNNAIANVNWGGNFATGGEFVVSKPTLFLAGEAGTEKVKVTPLGEEEDKQVFYEMLRELRRFNNETAPALAKQISLSVSGLGGKI
jgi:archaellum component FlaC